MTAQGKAAKGVTFQESPFAVALAAEVAKGPVVTASIMTNGIRIVDAAEQKAQAPPAGPVDAMMEADEEFARKLQAKMATQMQAGAGGRWESVLRPYCLV